MAIAALLLTIIKILVNLLIYIIKSISHKDKLVHTSEGTTCQYLIKSENGNICTNVLFKNNMKIGICPRHSCGGFYIESTKEDDMEIINSPFFLYLKKIIDLFPEFAAVLLSLNEIINK